MADSYNKKDREKKRQKRKKEKKEKKDRRKAEGITSEEFMYVDENGNLTTTPPDPTKKKVEYDLESIDISTPKSDKSDESNFIKEGIVKFFNSEKGYGFIVDRATQDSFFVHVDSLIDQIRDNDKVSFEVGSGPKGPVAVKVKLL